MLDRSHRLSRRKFLAQAAGLTIAAGTASAEVSRSRVQPPSIEGRKPIAVVCTVYRPMSHAYHIAGRFIQGYNRQGTYHLPKHYVRAMSVEQTPDNDLSHDIGRDFGVHVTRSVSDALTRDGQLAVDGVLLIGEHGNYPRNDRDQVLYPRHELMEKIVDVFRRTGKSVPVFNDKHLSYSWTKARQMYDWSRELKFPFLAGSSLPVTWRRPELELPLEAPIEDALVAAFGGLEIYGFHALEALQVMLERRKGGETGVKAVTCLRGDAVWKAADAGAWSWDLLDAALTRSDTLNIGDIRRNVGIPVHGLPASPPAAFLVEYRDGTRGTALLLNGAVQDFTFAARVRGEAKPASCLFYLPSPPGARYFDCLVTNIERLLESGHPPYPVERTLLTSGVLSAGMESHFRRARVETPELDVAYQAPSDSGFIRGTVTGT
jgi:hypothetical protein